MGSVLKLCLGKVHDQPVEIFGKHDLTGQPTRRALIDHALEQGLLRFTGRVHLAQPCRINIDMTRSARKTAATIPNNARDLHGYRSLHDGYANIRINCPTGDAVALHKDNFRHMPQSINGPSPSTVRQTRSFEFDLATQLSGKSQYKERALIVFESLRLRARGKPGLPASPHPHVGEQSRSAASANSHCHPIYRLQEPWRRIGRAPCIGPGGHGRSSCARPRPRSR
jgi:hypothetical protein